MDAVVLTDEAAVKALVAGLDKLPAEKQEFARGLVQKYQRYRGWTDKQSLWGHKLARLANGEQPAERQKVDGLGDLVALFDRAREVGKLKYPKLTFDDSAAGVPLQLSQAGAYARQPGSLNCTDGRPYGRNRWYGRVERSGTFVSSDDCPAELVEFLHKLAGDTANVAAMYGRRTGCCCFCNTALTDERSIEVGYGPVCAKRWNLPYPTKSEVRSRNAGREQPQLGLAA